jgi:hypothetical protein
LADLSPYEVGVYYFPNYHVDPRNELIHGKDWTEWEVLKQAKPRYSEHCQPKLPLWGYEDESSPKVFEKKIEAAADHRIDNFIFDWYWYDDGPFLNRALEQGYLGAANQQRLKFSLMWANHDWKDIHPVTPRGPRLLYPGAVTPKTFDQMTDYVVEKYFRQPTYWKLQGRPYFSIYELYRLVEGLGGVDGTRDALQRFRDKTKKAGCGDLHLNAVVWGVQVLPGEQKIKHPNQLLAALSFDSVTSYVWVHHVKLPEFPVTEYRSVVEMAALHWEQARAEYALPYIPNVTMGWDSSPRAAPSHPFTNSGYPSRAAMGGNTPEEFKKALNRVKTYLDRRPDDPKIFNINAWNEWTEGSYLEPDTVSGMGYLEAIRDVFST